MVYLIFFFFILFKKLICDNIVENKFIDCSLIQNEYDCELCNEKDNNCHCFWNNSKCETNKTKLKEKKWILDFNLKYNEQNNSEIIKYCGEIPKILNKSITIIPNINNEKYGKLNETIYCKYKTKIEKKSSLEISKFIIVNIIEDKNKPIIYSKINSLEKKTMELINFNNRKYYENNSQNLYLIFFVKMTNIFNTEPYKIEIIFYEGDKAYFYFILIIPFPILIIFLIINCVKIQAKIKSKNIKTLINNKQIYNINLQNYGNHCSICTENINIGNEVSLTPCKHIFHYLCFYHWVTNRNNNRYTKCPLCNTSLLKKINRNNELNNNRNMRPVNMT